MAIWADRLMPTFDVWPMPIVSLWFMPMSTLRSWAIVTFWSPEATVSLSSPLTSVVSRDGDPFD